VKKFRNLLAAGLLGLAPLALAGAAAAQDYPSQAITWIVPSSPGSGFDVIARIITPKLSEVLGQPIVIENLAGAGGTIGAARAADAKPDGYTILQVNINHTTAESLYKKLSYNLLTSFDPVDRFTTSSFVFLSSTKFGAKTLPEVISKAKANPGTINFGSGGVGSSTFIATELLMTTAGIDMTHIPYEGGGPSLAAEVAGETDFLASPYSTAKPFIESGQVNVLAISTKERAPYLPDVPTVAETLPGFEFTSWYGLVVPAGTPVGIREKIRSGMAEALQDSNVKARLAELGYDPLDEGPDEFGAFLKKDVATMKEIITKAGIEPQ
jgi:tripartite-type tricarboxylate transporter receptor subunit TctC